MWTQAFLLLAVVGTAGAGTTLALVAAVKGNRRLFRRAAVATGTITTGYVLMVAGAAALAPDRLLVPGDEKYICELDCHLAYSVVDVRRDGRSLTVQLNVRFDAQTVSRSRPRDLPVYPGSRKVRLVDSAGEEYPPVSLGDLQRTLLPGQSYRTALIFDVDPGARGLVLYIADGDPSKMVLVGSDNALLRRPAGFQL